MLNDRAALLIDNQALAGTVAASSQELTMPAANLLTPHPSERWRSLAGESFFVLDKGQLSLADTVLVKGLLCSSAAIVRLRLSSADSTGGLGDVYDSGSVANGSANLDVNYFAAAWCLDDPDPWRYARFDISDLTRSYNEAGSVCTGLREPFEINFKPGGNIGFVDRSGVQPTAGGLTLTLEDNWFRRCDLSFDVREAQRWDLIERLDRVAGRHRNVLLVTQPDSTNLPRDCFYGLVTDLMPNVFGDIVEIYGKQLRISERV